MPKTPTRILRQSAILPALALIGGLSLSTITLTAHADDKTQSPALSAQAKAQQVLNRAINAAGGYDALSQFRNSQITFSTMNANPGQAPTPTLEPTLGNAFRSVTHHSNGRTAIENYNGENLGFRYVRGAGPDWVYLAGQNAVALIDTSVGENIIDRTITNADLLLSLSDHSASLRYAGTVSKDEKKYSIVTFADDLNRTQNLYFNNENGALTKAEHISAHEQWGDISTIKTFTDFKPVNKFSLAHKITIRQKGITTIVADITDVNFNAVDGALFIEPEGAAQNDPFTGASNAPRTLEIEELAKNIYFIPNAAQGYNVIFVNNRDGITVLETPQSTQAARDIVRTIGEKFPSRKIKRAVPTHHHFDHSGGIYGFLEAGIPILTTPGNEEFVSLIGTAPRNIGNNKGTPEKISVSSFAEKYTLGRGSRKIQLFNVGPNPHAEEIVIAYLPAIKTVFVADIFSARGETIPPANANQLAFAEQLEKLDLDIETFIPVHGRKATATEFWDSVQRGRAAAQSN